MFTDVMPALIQQKRVARRDWRGKKCICFIRGNLATVWLGKNESLCLAYYVIREKDLTRDDWFIIR